MYRVNLYTYVSSRGFGEGDCAAGYVLECISVPDENPVADPLADIEILHGVTRQQSELQVLIRALKRMRRPSDIEIFTESAYVADGILRWSRQWRENNWKRSDGTAISNQREWQELVELAEPHNYSFHLKEPHKFTEWLKTETVRRLKKG